MKPNTLSLLQRLSRYLKLNIEKKLGIAFVGLSAASILMIGVFAIATTTRYIRNNTIAELEHFAEEVSIRLQDFLNVVDSDLTYIMNSKQFQAVSTTLMDDHSSEADAFLDFIRGLMQNKQFYYEIKYLEEFTEPLSLVRNPENLEETIISKKQTSWNFYHLLVNPQYPVDNLVYNEMVMVPVELSTQNSNETLSAFSFVMPYSIDGQSQKGLLVANVFASQIFSIIETSVKKRDVFTAAIVDKEGNYLYHSIRMADWNKWLAEKNKFNIFSDFSKSNALEIILGDMGYIEETDNLVFHMPLLWGSSALNQNYSFLLSQPKSVIFVPLRKFILYSIVFVVAFLLIAFFLSHIATKQFVQPIQNLQKGSDIIAQGDFTHRLDIQTGDEIQELAEKFNQMAQSIQERDKQLHDHSFELEKKVLERTNQLTEEKNKLQIILDNVPSAFILLDKNYQILTASRAIKDLTGYGSDESIGKRCYELFGYSDICDYCVSKLTDNSKISRTEFKITNNNEPSRVIELICVPVHQDNRETMHLEILTDITTRKEMQKQILQSEKLASIGEMAAVLAHEMRNSLTSAKMLMQLLSQSQHLPKPDKESLEVALTSIQRIDKITNDLLSFSQPSELKKALEDIRAIIQESVQLSKHHFEKQNILITLDLDENVPNLWLDRSLFQEVVMNILLNGSQSIGENGTIHISLTQSILSKDFHGAKRSTNNRSESEEITLTKGLSVVTLTISDSGPGIQPDKLDRIFDPFFTTKLEGTGLGLSMAKRVVSEHGGIIFAENTKGSGACLSIIIPITTGDSLNA
ncbi:MAG: HAMP domain-containing protein [Candidatus Marinimicrobia bacterium]|nr:HAMP domain-containing protein [Candidatus Neomarinimicrobiota bacterium]